MNLEKECRPVSFFSSNYIINGLASGPATAEYDTFSHQGMMEVGGKTYLIVKHGMFSGHWSLEGVEPFRLGEQRDSLAHAHQIGLLRSHVEVVGMGFHLSVKPTSFFGRDFDIWSEGRPVGLISPAHIFSRRSKLFCSDEIPDVLQVFIFWWVGLVWRRSQHAAASS